MLQDVSQYWDKKLPYVQDATPKERYYRLMKRWTELRGAQSNWVNWERYLAIHSVYHYAYFAHCDGTIQSKRYFSQQHWEMYLFYEMMLPLLKIKALHNVPANVGIAARRLYLGPREIGKSIALRISLMWLLFHNPKLRILYGRANAKDAELGVGWIKSVYENNAFIAEYFPDYVVDIRENKPASWAKTGLLLPTAIGGDRITQEVTVTPSGVDKTVTGGHYDIFAPDDYVTETNSFTKNMLDRTIRVLGEMFSIMGQWGLWCGCGTHWDKEDAYAWLRGTYSPDGAHIDSDITCKAVAATTLKNAEGEPTFPTIHNVEYLRRTRTRVTPYVYACLYDNDPTLKRNNTFEMEDTCYYQMRHLVAKQYRMPIFVFFDGSADNKPGSDKAAIVVVAMDVQEPPNLYVLEVHNGRFSDTQLIAKFIAIYDYWRGHEICERLNFYMQQVVFEKKYKNLLHHLVNKERPGIKFQSLARSTTIPKWVEIGSLQPFHSRGQVFMRVREDEPFHELDRTNIQEMERVLTPDMKPLWKQMERHVRGRKDQEDDCIDAFAQSVKVMSRSGKQEETPENKPARTPLQIEQEARKKRMELRTDFESRYQAGEFGDPEKTMVVEAIAAYREEYGTEREPAANAGLFDDFL